MKRDELVNAYMNDCAELDALYKSDPEAWMERIQGDTQATLWQACINDGWTVAELDAAYAQRFGRAPKRASS